MTLIRPRNIILFPLVALVLFAPACFSPPPEKSDSEVLDDLYRREEDQSRMRGREDPVLSYLEKRALDLLDIFSLRVTAGPGLRVHARATKIFQLGLGKMGPAEGATMGHTFPLYKLGWLKRQGGLWKERSLEVGISLFYYYQTMGEPMGGNKTSFGEEEDRGFWDVGGAAHFLLIGLEAEVRLDEVLDAVTGFFGMDIMRDDRAYRDPDILEEDELE